MKSNGISTYADRLAFRLIRHAARRAPAELSERLEEEWHASLGDVVGPTARLRFALGCWRATSVIAQEQRTATHAAGGAATVHGPTFGFSYFNEHGLSRRTVAFIVVASLHVGVFYAFVAGLTPPAIDKPVIHIFENRAPIQKPPLRDPVTIAKPTPEKLLFQPVQPPELTEPPPERPESIGAVKVVPDTTGAGSGEPIPPPPPIKPAVTARPGGPGVGFPSTADYYPSASIHQGEQGAVTVQTCVDVAGRLTADPTLTKSSGSKRLDEAALRLAKAGSGHYRASTENDKPINACYQFGIRFTLN